MFLYGRRRQNSSFRTSSLFLLGSRLFACIFRLTLLDPVLLLASTFPWRGVIFRLSRNTIRSYVEIPGFRRLHFFYRLVWSGPRPSCLSVSCKVIFSLSVRFFVIIL